MGSLQKYILVIIFTLLLNINPLFIHNGYTSSTVQEPTLYQDYILYVDSGAIHLDKIDIKKDGGHVARIYTKKILEPKARLGSLLVQKMTMFSDQKRVLFINMLSLSDGNHLIESNIEGNTWSDYYPPPVHMEFPRLSKKDYLAFLSDAKPAGKDNDHPYYNLSYCTGKNEKIITFHPPFWVKYYRPPSWNSDSNLIAVSDMDDNIYIFELDGKYHFLCKGYLGTFSPTNKNQITVVEPTLQSLVLYNFDKNFNIISKDTVVQMVKKQGLLSRLDIIVSHFPLVYSQDGKRIYYEAKRNTPFLSFSEGGKLEGVDITTKTTFKLIPGTYWDWTGCFSIQPTNELLKKISNKN